MIINPSTPVNIQGTEELQSVEGSVETMTFGQESPFENTLTTMQGEGELESKLFLLEGELSEDLTTEESLSEENGILLAALPVASTGAHLQPEESLLKTAQIDPTTDHTKSQFLPIEDSVKQLKEQVTSMKQLSQAQTIDLTAATPESIPEVQDTEAPTISNIKSVLHPVQSENSAAVIQETAAQIQETGGLAQQTGGLAQQTGGLAQQTASTSDPRIQIQEAPKDAIERTKVSIDEQLNRASAQLDMEKNGTAGTKMREAAALTAGTILYKSEVEQEESALKRQLMQQFRAITPEETLSSTTPQPLTEFSDNINFNQAVNPSGNPKDFASQSSTSKSPITRNIPELSEVFVKTDQEEVVQDIDPSLELDTGFDQVLNELGEKTETTASKDSRPIIGESTSSRTVSKEAAPNLDQIMSKVNFKENGTREVTLQLTPKELGDMTMKIHQDGNTMAVEMIVGSMEAKQMLEANLPELRARFLEQEDTSFNQLRFSVDVEQHSFSKSGQTPEHGGSEGDYIAGKQREGEEAKAPVSQQYQKAGFNSGVNIYA